MNTPAQPLDSSGPGPADRAASPDDGASGAAVPQVDDTKWTSGILGRLLLLAVVVLLLGQIIVAWFAVDGFERELEPQLGRKAEVVGRAVADQIAFAVDDLGIPPEELVGVDTFLAKILASNPDIEYIIILDGSSRVLLAQGLSPEELESVRRGLPGPGVEAGAMTEIEGFTDSPIRFRRSRRAAGQRGGGGEGHIDLCGHQIRVDGGWQASDGDCRGVHCTAAQRGRAGGVHRRGRKGDRRGHAPPGKGRVLHARAGVERVWSMTLQRGLEPPRAGAQPSALTTGRRGRGTMYSRRHRGQGLSCRPLARPSRE